MTRDILDEFEQQRRAPAYPSVPATTGLVVEDRASGFCGDVVKVDAGFIRGAGRGDATSLAFLRAAQGIGEATGAVVLAEGIETPVELAAVVDVGIIYGQGNLLGLPAAAARD